MVTTMWSRNGTAADTMRRKDAALARYARWEYGGDGAWFVAQANRQARTRRGESLLARLGARFRRPKRTAEPLSAGSAACATASDGGVLLEPLQETCGHEELDHLGEGGPASYFRCGTCGTVLIAQGGSLWALVRSPDDPR